jgi:hypothetical protein
MASHGQQKQTVQISLGVAQYSTQCISHESVIRLVKKFIKIRFVDIQYKQTKDVAQCQESLLAYVQVGRFEQFNERQHSASLNNGTSLGGCAACNVGQSPGGLSLECDT